MKWESEREAELRYCINAGRERGRDSDGMKRKERGEEPEIYGQTVSAYIEKYAQAFMDYKK